MLTYIAFYKLLFTVELSVAEFLFTFRLKKRSYYPLRFAAVVIALIGRCGYTYTHECVLVDVARVFGDVRSFRFGIVVLL